MNGLRIALTGAPGQGSRDDFKDQIREAGATYVSRMDEHTDLLVIGTSPLASKVESARRLGVDTVDWDAFVARFEEPVDETVPLAEVPVGLPALERDATGVRVLDLRLPRCEPGPLTPSLEAFADYTLDAPTLEVLRGLGRSILLGHPCLLEGDTASSKTSAVRFLAALTGAEVVRLNLNGQTDTGELVGRYVPDEGGGWRFAEGLIPQAMRHGWWVILDEVNLAEPAVLERLNPCLERSPALVLTEGPGTRFGPGGEVPVHANFRVIATMNPAEYAGRSVLSPAWRDRFVGTVVARSVGELELRQLLEHLVHGVQPEVEVHGRRWAPATVCGPGRPALAEVEAFRPVWARLATLFAGLIEMSSPTASQGAPLGVRRRERYVFSRRGVLALLDALEGLPLCDAYSGAVLGLTDAPRALLVDAVAEATVRKMRDAEDRQRVETLVRSLDLGL